MSAGPPELPFPLGEYETRIERTRAALRAEGLDAVLVGQGANLTYLTGYPSPPASPSRPVLFAISRLGGRAGHGLGLAALEPPSVSEDVRPSSRPAW